MVPEYRPLDLVSDRTPRIPAGGSEVAAWVVLFFWLVLLAVFFGLARDGISLRLLHEL